MSEQVTNQNDIIYPGEWWSQYTSPEEAGYSSQGLEQAKDYCKQIGTEALLVVHNGAILLAWGDVTRRSVGHSVRKSYMNALYGIHVSQGNIDLYQTLAELNIDDEPPLTEAEKKARVVDLLASRSGVYHPAAAETLHMIENRPERDSHKPGDFWFYNNWDFNTLLTIFEQKTGTRFFEEFKQKLADPLQMEEFRLIDTFYFFQKDKSVHPAYHSRMSAKDMARFGLLYLRQGKWKGQQIFPESWLTETITPYSDVPDGERSYGYLWWMIGPQHSNRRLYELKTYMAHGSNGQLIVVLPGANLVVVHLTNTYFSEDFESKQFWTLLDLILEAKVSSPAAKPNLVPFQDPLKRFKIVTLEPSAIDKYVGDYEFEDGGRGSIRIQDDKLIVTTLMPPTYLLPISETTFILEDFEISLTFTPDNDDHQLAVELAPDKVIYGKLVRNEVKVEE